MWVILDRFGLELSLEQGADALKALVDGFGVGHRKTHHGVGDLGRIDLGVFQELRGLLSTDQDMIVRWHQTIHYDLRQWSDVSLNATKEIQIIFRLKENTLAVVAAIVDVIIQTRNKRRLSSGHSHCSQTSEFCQNSEVYWRDEPSRVMGMGRLLSEFTKILPLFKYFFSSNPDCNLYINESTHEPYCTLHKVKCSNTVHIQ